MKLFDWIRIKVGPAQSAPDVFVPKSRVIERRFIHKAKRLTNDMRRRQDVDPRLAG
jgi:hypothetical protein